MNGQKSTGAAGTPVILPRINLICHGMMLLWQDKANPTSGITIYLPHTRGPGGPQSHEAKLSVMVGGEPNLLATDGNYSLTFGVRPAALGPRSTQKHLALYDDDGTKDLNINPGNVRIAIRVPYPNRIRRHRVMKFTNSGPAYRPGTDTQVAFAVAPAELAGVHVLTYEGVTAPITLLRPNGTAHPDMNLAAPPMLMNLHLYSSAMDMSVPNHLQFFNNLLRHRGRPNMDLEASNMLPGTIPLDLENVENDLSRLAISDLSELPGQLDGQRYEDPVGCVEGWGS